MISFSLTSPVDSPRVKIVGSKLLVAEDQAFVIGLSTSGTNSPNTYTVTYSDGSPLPGTALIVGTNFQGNFPEALVDKVLLFTAQNGEVGTLDLRVFPKFRSEFISPRVYRISNYTTTMVTVELTNHYDESIDEFTLGGEESKQVTLPEDGFYKVKFTQGAEVRYLGIVETAMVNKFYTDTFRALFCKKCGKKSGKEAMLGWNQLSAMRDAFMLSLHPKHLKDKLYNEVGFQTFVTEFLKSNEILENMKKLVKELVDNKCLQGCDCGC